MSVYTSPYKDVSLPRNDENLFQFLQQRIDLHGDKIAVIDGLTGQSYTYNEFKCLVQKVACGLYQHGLRRGDVIVISARNCVEYFLVEMGAFAVGGLVSNSSPQSTKHEMKVFLSAECNQSPVKFAFVDKQSYQNVRSASKAVKTLDDFKIFALDETDGCTPFGSLLENDASNFSYICAKVTGDDAATVFFSSGSTGVPKGIVGSQHGIAVNICQLVETDVCPQKVTLCVGPFFHVSSLLISKLPGIYVGATIVIIPNYNKLDVLLEMVQKFQVTDFFCAPALIIALLRGNLDLSNYDLSSLKLVIVGGVATHPVLVSELYERLPHVHLSQIYGMTEVGSVAAVQPRDYRHTDSRTVLLPHFKAKVLNTETGKTLGPNCRGELVVKTPSMMCAYLNSPEEYRKSFTQDGWFRTGDGATVDEHGRIQIVDRIKNMMKVYNRTELLSKHVLPTEIEALLVSHSEIVDAVVVGIPDPDAPNYDLPRAFVILKNGAQLSEEDVKNFVKERLSPIKWLTGGVVFLDEFPRSELGKVLRQKLRSANF